MVTGKDPRKVEATLPRTVKHWSTRRLAGYLFDHGWDVLLLKPSDVILSRTRHNWNAPTLTNSHVVLLNALTSPTEASWFLAYDGLIWHNFVADSQSPLFLLRRPLQDAILIRQYA